MCETCDFIVASLTKRRVSDRRGSECRSIPTIRALVCPNGEIVGTDPALTAIDAAETRVRATSLPNVTFRYGDPAEMSFDKPFDAVVGRYILQFMQEPSFANWDGA
jgi:ubiquinone/menaquinone biosynthesis C-methylase UbiE